MHLLPVFRPPLSAWNNISVEFITELNLSSCSQAVPGIYVVHTPKPELTSNSPCSEHGCSAKLRVVSFGAPQQRQKPWEKPSPLPELSCVGREGAVPGLGAASPCPGCSTGTKVILFSHAITQHSCSGIPSHLKQHGSRSLQQSEVL